MKKKTEPSQYDFFKGRFIFANEPKWFQLAVLLIFVAFVLGIGIIIRGSTIPFWATSVIAGIKFSGLFNLFKGRSP